MGTIPTPGTQAASAVVASTLLNGFRDVMRDLQSPSICYAYQSTAQSLANVTYTAITLNAEITDQPGLGDSPMHDLVTNNSRIVIRTTATYQITGSVGFASNATGARKAQLYKNGTTGLAEATSPAVSGVSTTVQVVSPWLPLAAGDYIEIRGYQSSTAALNTDASAGVTWLAVRRFGL